jgi:hypothetical protein
VTKSPSNGATVAGRIKWRVAIHGHPKRLAFSVDQAVQSRRPHRRRIATANLDTTTLSNGQHTLKVIAYGAGGRRLGKSRITVQVSNDAGNGPNTVFWGAGVGPQLTGSAGPWDMNAVSKFEQLAGKKLSMVQLFGPFANCSSSPCQPWNFPTTAMEDVRQHGSIPFLSWASQSDPSSTNEPDFQLSDVINGTYDSYIHNFATAAKNWGHPFFLRFNWEMNGNWFPWTEGANGNKPGEYVAAWRHVHDIFTSVGATNATWAWCPNVDSQNSLQSLNSLYPGDSYVDWTCLDGYNFGTNPARPQGWQSFDQLFNPTYQKITGTIAPSKPMVIGEVGSSEIGGSKASWIQDMLSKIPTKYPKIRGVLYFDWYTENMDWPLETSDSVTNAFASGIQSPVYTTNNYANLPAGAIQPPS